MIGMVVTIVRAITSGANLVVTAVGCWFGMLYGTVAWDVMHQLGVGHEIAVSTAFLVGTTGFFERQHVQRTADRAKHDAERGVQQVEVVLNTVIQRVFHEGCLVIHHHHHHYHHHSLEEHGAAEQGKLTSAQYPTEGEHDWPALNISHAVTGEDPEERE